MAAVRGSDTSSSPRLCAVLTRLSPRAQIRHNMQSFLAGSVAALAFGYYRLHQDVWQAAGEVTGNLNSMGSETVTSHAALQARVIALEADLAKLRAKVEAKAK